MNIKAKKKYRGNNQAQRIITKIESFETFLLLTHDTVFSTKTGKQDITFSLQF